MSDLYRVEFDIDGENGPVRQSLISKVSDDFNTSDAYLYETEEGISQGIIYCDSLTEAMLSSRVPYEEDMGYIEYENLTQEEVKSAIDELEKIDYSRRHVESELYADPKTHVYPDEYNYELMMVLDTSLSSHGNHDVFKVTRRFGIENPEIFESTPDNITCIKNFSSIDKLQEYCNNPDDEVKAFGDDLQALSDAIDNEGLSNFNGYDDATSVARVHMLPRRNKEFDGSNVIKGDVLIDDYDKNLNDWAVEK